MAIPLFATSLERYQPRIAQRLAEVAASGRYILGPEVEAFEREFAEYLGVKHCVGVANGTDALEIALRALGVGAGDEVVVPSFTFYATAEAVAAIGARPVFCDIDPETLCVTAETVDRALTPRTRAVVPVHLFGNVAPVPELRQLGVPVLEDAAQAAGASLAGVRAGALGDAATFSFFPSKNLPCLGDGGAIATDRDDVAQLARRLRFHGSDDKSTFVEVGYNSRLDELQAAVLRLLLPELDGWNAARRAAATAYERHGVGASASRHRARSRARTTSTTCTWCAASGPTSCAPRSRRGAWRPAATTGCRSTASRPWPSLPRVPSCRPPRKRRGRIWRCRWARSSATIRSARWLTRARLGRPDEQPPRAGHAPADRRDAGRRARGAGHGPRLRADGGAARALRHGARRDRPPPRRAQGEQGGRPGLAQPGACALRPWAALRRRDGPRVERRDGGRAAAGRAGRDRLRLRVGGVAAPGQLPPGASGGRARGDPARTALPAMAPAASCAATPV